MKREELYRAKLAAAKAELKLRARTAQAAFRKYDKVVKQIEQLEKKLENIKLARAQ